MRKKFLQIIVNFCETCEPFKTSFIFENFCKIGKTTIINQSCYFNEPNQSQPLQKFNQQLPQKTPSKTPPNSSKCQSSKTKKLEQETKIFPHWQFLPRANYRCTKRMPRYIIKTKLTFNNYTTREPVPLVSLARYHRGKLKSMPRLIQLFRTRFSDRLSTPRLAKCDLFIIIPNKD